MVKSKEPKQQCVLLSHAPAIKLKMVPCTGYELNDRSKQKKCTVECQTHVPPVLPKEAIKHFKPLDYTKNKVIQWEPKRKMKVRFNGVEV